MTPAQSRPTVDSLSQRLGFQESVVEVGMTHPGVRYAMSAVGGTTTFLVELDDDRITELEVEIGLGHRGFEKEVESRTFDRALPYVARLGFANGVLAETAYCLAVERLGQIALPDRAIWLRTMVNEIARIADHFARLGAVMSAIGLRDAELSAHQAEVTSARLLAAATQGGPFSGWMRIGGVSKPLPEDFTPYWTESQRRLLLSVAEFESIGARNPTCQRRLRDVAPMSLDECLDWGVTGTSLRAAGSPTDVRRDRPYLAYGALDFDVPIGENGDDLDRMLVILEELRQSLLMVEQCHKLLASLGPGEIAAPIPESEEEAEPRAFCLPEGECVATIESSTGEFAFLIASDGSPVPRRVRCRPPSLFHAQALPEMLRGARLDDLLPTVALLHLVSAECDR